MQSTIYDVTAPVDLVNEYRFNIEVYAEKISVDEDLTTLSSVKLLSVLRLHQVEGCQLEVDFIEQLKTELILRGDDLRWSVPH